MATLLCDGWWEQEEFGRQSMSDLVIEFCDGALSGSGDDIVGRFLIDGRIEGAQITIQKQYIGKHSIQYHGTTDGEGVYFGDWSTGGYIGGEWSIRFRSQTPSEKSPIRQLGKP